MESVADNHGHLSNGWRMRSRGQTYRRITRESEIVFKELMFARYVTCILVSIWWIILTKLVQLWKGVVFTHNGLRAWKGRENITVMLIIIFCSCSSYTYIVENLKLIKYILTMVHLSSCSNKAKYLKKVRCCDQDVSVMFGVMFSKRANWEIPHKIPHLVTSSHFYFQ